MWGDLVRIHLRRHQNGGVVPHQDVPLHHGGVLVRVPVDAIANHAGQVPCHGDLGPRNRLEGPVDEGTLGVELREQAAADDQLQVVDGALEVGKHRGDSVFEIGKSGEEVAVGSVGVHNPRAPSPREVLGILVENGLERDAVAGLVSDPGGILFDLLNVCPVHGGNNHGSVVGANRTGQVVVESVAAGDAGAEGVDQLVEEHLLGIAEDLGVGIGLEGKIIG